MNVSFALMNIAIYDAVVSSWKAKDANSRNALPPASYDDTLAVLVPTGQHPSFPSEHAAVAAAAAIYCGCLTQQENREAATLLSFIAHHECATFMTKKVALQKLSSYSETVKCAVLGESKDVTLEQLVQRITLV